MNVRRQTVKKYRKEIIILALFVLACLSLFLLGEGMFTLLEDETADKLLRETLARFLAFAFIVPVMPLCGCGKVLHFSRPPRAYIWCLPCLFVAVANFPFSAVFDGAATVERTDLIWLFALEQSPISLVSERLDS